MCRVGMEGSALPFHPEGVLDGVPALCQPLPPSVGLKEYRVASEGRLRHGRHPGASFDGCSGASARPIALMAAAAAARA